jgi:hypothetical protein
MPTSTTPCAWQNYSDDAVRVVGEFAKHHIAVLAVADYDSAVGRDLYSALQRHDWAGAARQWPSDMSRDQLVAGVFRCGTKQLSVASWLDPVELTDSIAVVTDPMAVAAADADALLVAASGLGWVLPDDPGERP